MKKVITLIAIIFLSINIYSQGDDCAMAREAQYMIDAWSDLQKQLHQPEEAYTSLEGFGYYKQESKTTASHRQTLSRIEYYNRRYPNNKFISTEGLNKVLIDYKLACVPSRYFIDPVPAKNARDVSEFMKTNKNVAEEDWKQRVGSKSTHGHDNGVVYWDNGRQARKYRSIYDKVEDNEELFVVCSKQMVDHDLFQRNLGNGFGSISPISKKLNAHIPELRESPPDPIILLPVEGGFIVITKWLMSHCYPTRA